MASGLAAAKGDLAPKGDEAFESVLTEAMADPEIAAVAAESNDGGNAPDISEPQPEPTPEPVAAPEPEPVAEPVVAEPAQVPQTDVTPVTPPVDPLADTAPLDYGQGKAFDGVLVDKTNGGAFILPDQLDTVRARLTEADTFREQAEKLNQRVQHYDGLTFRTTGVDGNPPQEFKGIDAFVQAQATSAALAQGLLVLMGQIEQSFPGAEFAQARTDLYDKMQFAVQKTAFQTGQSIRSRIQSAEQAVVSQATQGQQEATWFANTISAIQKALPSLTVADVEAGKQFFAKRPQLLYHNASVQDAQQYGVKVGERIGDPTAMNEWYSERAALRAEQAKDQSARATAASTANKHNAAMEKGRQPANTGKRAQKPATPAATSPEKPSRRDAWASPLTDALQELGVDG